MIEGWRGINHSYALVNQNQLLQLRNSHFELFHNDLSFYNPKWSKALNGSGFDESSSQQLSNIPSLDNNLIQSDITYRISFPYRFYSGNTKMLFVYGTSEFQHIDGYVYQNDLKSGISNASLKIITPSYWFKEGFLRAGFLDEQVVVVPHEVSDVFGPISSERRLQNWRHDGQ